MPELRNPASDHFPQADMGTDLSGKVSPFFEQLHK
jgi:hypothetical protein